MNNVTNVLIVGVGGQGTILASRVLSGVVQAAGYDVKVSEIHGMSQRGGSVVTQVRFGEKVNSPIIPAGKADLILAFELLEAMRHQPALTKDGKIIVNVQKIMPMPVVIGAAEYPENGLEELKAKADVTALDALDIAMKCNNPKAVNVVLLGVLSAHMDIAEQVWLDVLKEKVPAKFLEANLLAFAEGRKAAGK